MHFSPMRAHAAGMLDYSPWLYFPTQLPRAVSYITVAHEVGHNHGSQVGYTTAPYRILGSTAAVNTLVHNTAVNTSVHTHSCIPHTCTHTHMYTPHMYTHTCTPHTCTHTHMYTPHMYVSMTLLVLALQEVLKATLSCSLVPQMAVGPTTDFSPSAVEGPWGRLLMSTATALFPVSVEAYKWLACSSPPNKPCDEVVCRVGEHQHQLAHRCSLCENFHTYIHTGLWGWGIYEWAIYGLKLVGQLLQCELLFFWEICSKNTGL